MRLVAGDVLRGLRAWRRPWPAPDVRRVVRAIRAEGYLVVPGYLDPAQCATARAEIDALLHEHPEATHHDTSLSDHRLYGAERRSAVVGAFHEDPWLRSCCEAYLQRPARALVTLAARLDPFDGQGSGGGWHRDAVSPQFKALLYLSDVGPDQGPFEYVRGSHHWRTRWRDRRRGRFGRQQTRLAPEAVARLLTDREGRAVRVTGPAGTLVLADTGGIHRGHPLTAGSRHALTNYYYALNAITPALRQKFEPLVPAVGADGTGRRSTGG